MRRDRMGIMRATLLTLTLAAAFCIAGGAVARAQDPLQPLVDFINSHLPYPNSIAYAGRDWCFNAAADAGPTWWPFNYQDPNASLPTMQTNQIWSASRIKLIYGTNDGKGNMLPPFKFASIFMGLDTTQQTTPTPTTPTLSKPPKLTIIFPDNAKSECMPFADFIRAAFANYIQGTYPTATTLYLDFDPTCNGNDMNDSTCDTVPVPGPMKKLPKRQKSISDANNYLTWVFSGGYHQIAGAYRFYVHFQDKDGKDVVTGFLTVGYGGNGGPG